MPQILQNPEQDTLPTTLSRTDPNWELIPDIASSHFGTWLSVGVSVLGFEDPSFPPHNVRYDTIYTPLSEDMDRAVEVYQGGHVNEVTADAATALQAQGYTVVTIP